MATLLIIRTGEPTIFYDEMCWLCGIAKESKYARGFHNNICGECWQLLGGFPEQDIRNAPWYRANECDGHEVQRVHYRSVTFLD